MHRHFKCVGLLVGSLAGTLCASEFHPQKPFAQLVDLPAPGQLVATPWFTYTAFQSYWQGRDEVDVSYGDNEFDVEYYAMFASLEYGLWNKWAVDLTIGYVDEATRVFNTAHEVEKTNGLMDTQFGIRYRLLEETPESKWTPTVAFRVGGIISGTYDELFPFAPGYGETGIEPGFFARKTVWGSGGLYGSLAYRHMVTLAPDSVLFSIGFFQKYKQFTVSAGYRQQQAMSGPDLTSTNPPAVDYNNRIRELNYMAEWGGSYEFPSGIKMQFYMNSNFDGRNTGEKLTYAGYVSFPFQLKRR